MWKNIDINKNLVKAGTERAVLIAMPHNSEFGGYSFWHPAKLVRNGNRGDMVSIGYTDEFQFRLKKYGKGRYNSREVIDEIPLAGDEFEAIFKSLGDDIALPPEEPLIYTPEHLDPENATADESLIDYD